MTKRIEIKTESEVMDWAYWNAVLTAVRDHAATGQYLADLVAAVAAMHGVEIPPEAA